MQFELIVDKKQEEKVQATVHRQSLFTDNLERFVMEYNGSDSLLAFAEDEIKVIRFAELECVSVIGGKTYVIDSSGRQYRIRMRLYEAEKLLPLSFIKINKSTIANKSKIERFSAAFSGSVNVIFKSGYTDYVSRRCFAEIKKELKK